MLGNEIIVLISEVPLIQGESNTYLCKVGTQSSVLNKHGVLISEVSFQRGSTVHAHSLWTRRDWHCTHFNSHLNAAAILCHRNYPRHLLHNQHYHSEVKASSVVKQAL